MHNVHFDQYQRYKTAQILVKNMKKKLDAEKISILEIGANEHRNLEKFCPIEEVRFLDIEVPDYLLSDPRYILGDATNLVNVNDDSYDLVIALDVYEHIPRDKREAFISELVRVSKYGVFIGAPFYTVATSNLEKRGNFYYKSIHKIDHRWLLEHIENGLPHLDTTLKFIESLNQNYFVFEQGSLEIWETINYYLWQVEGIDTDCENLINTFYNNEIYMNDISSENYRKFIFISSNQDLCQSVNKDMTACFNCDKNKFDETLRKVDRIISLFNDLLLKKDVEKIRIQQEQTSQKEIAVTKKNRKLYLDSGRGFSEDEIIVFDLDENGKVLIDLTKTPNIERLRVDFAESKIVFLLNEIKLIFEEKEHVVRVNDCKSNAKFIYHNLFGFLDDDPYLIIENTDLKGIKQILFQIEILEEGF